jgi:hypothetical protein
MHAVGFWHEHSRSDRDDYLTIRWENIEESMNKNFNKLAPNQNHLLEPFNYNSIMIYGEKSFSKNGQVTMAAKNGIHLTEPYDKTGFAKTDIDSINKLYQCQ